jgi:NitT/TauT family transport system substrate-binding protein
VPAAAACDVAICIAPKYVAEELLQAEGFTEVQYVEAVAGARVAKALASGAAHIS